MLKDDWKIIEKRLKEFWKPGEEILCLRVFSESDSKCELCGHKPLKWNHLLLNSETNATMKVGSNCVVNFRKVIEKLGLDNKILYFEEYEKLSDFINNIHKGTTEIIKIKPAMDFIKRLLSRSDEIDSETLTSILDYTVRLDTSEGKELHEEALIIYAEKERSVYLEESKLEQEIEEEIKSFREEAKLEMEEYFESQYADYHEIADNSCSEKDWSDSFDDMEPEDWENHLGGPDDDILEMQDGIENEKDYNNSENNSSKTNIINVPYDESELPF